MATMSSSPLRRRMIEDMTLRNLSPSTQQSYVYAVANFRAIADHLRESLSDPSLTHDRGDAGRIDHGFTDEEKRARLCLVASPDGRDGSVVINQDAAIYVSLLEPAGEVVHPLGEQRNGWVQVARGAIVINGQDLNQGDGAAITDEATITITGREPAELLLFDLA